MGYRSGFTLVELMTEAREMTESPEVLISLDAAIDYATSGPDSGGHRYPRGPRLVNNLRDASRAARKHNQRELSTRLTNFANYAAGELPLIALETLYVPGYRTYDERYMHELLKSGMKRSSELLQEFTRMRPEASADEMRDWFSRTIDSMDKWTIAEDRLGGVKLKHSLKDRLTWLEKIRIIVDNHTDDIKVPLEVIEQISKIPGADLVTQAVQWQRRRSALSRLKEVVEDPDSSERDIHEELKNQTWIFGGRYTAELENRRISMNDEIDIPLLRGDGSLHVVELKKANTPNLIEPLRSHHNVGIEVHRAVSQAANYLRTLDENRAHLLAEQGIECRRSFATVLIGHPKFIGRTYEPSTITSTLRTYNATLNRIEVMTYEELIASAERSLVLNEEQGNK